MYIALDIGGTQLRAALYPDDGLEPIVKKSIPTHHDDEKPENRLLQLIESVWPSQGEVFCIGGGVAIPHARKPIVLDVLRPMLSLCYLKQPIDFGAIDGRPVHTFFTIISPTIKTHLGLLARLAFALREAGFARKVADRSGCTQILEDARRIDTLLSAHEQGEAERRP